MAAQNKPNFALFTSSDPDFLEGKLFTEMDFLTEQTELRNKRHFNGFACVVLCLYVNRYDARWILKLKAKILENGGMVE